MSPGTETSGRALARRFRELPGYPLEDIPRIKEELRSRGVEVIDLGAGDPDLDVPEAARSALKRAADDPELQGYAFQRGLPAFRESVADFMERRFGRRPDPDDDLLPLLGSKEGIAHFAFTVLDPGDRVLVPDPGYAPYFGGSYLAGAEVERVELRAEHGFRLPPEAIRGAGDGLKLVYLNYPNNPTGACVDRDYLRRAVEACRERDAVLLYDHAYSEVAFDGYRPPGLLDVPGGTDVGIEFHSLSKTFNMTGWRLGWAVGNPTLVRALSRVKSFFDTGAYLPIQAAGAETLDRMDAFLPGHLETLRRRRDAAVEAFRGAGFEAEAPRATLYLWMPVPTDEASEDFARRVLEETGVVLMPGSALGAGGEGYVRAALTVPEGRLREAGRRIGAIL
ncbi:MAG: aminotransferase class I/II-fold pyridoxal phosphate-dependent enzyme [Candidatus Palauibacterales bacterium]|nr:aminotransferase class I/II-fold pyridoxal phosphate-dependent enzyme [Candidatus Palauibacterales bacterium]